MLRLAVLAALCAGIALCADEPPKKLTAEERKELETKWKELNSAGIKAHQTGKFPEATKAWQEALEVARMAYPKTEFPNGHEYLATSLNNLGFLLQDQGKLADAEPLAREALEMYKRLCKGDHPIVGICLTNLAVILQDQGRVGDAELLFRDALEMRRRLFKGDHPDLATSLSSLALVLQEQGKLADAELLFRDGLDMNRRLYKGNHPNVAASMNNLAIMLLARGKVTDAELLFRDALDMKKRLYKGDHPDVAGNLGNLALLLRAQGKLADAELLARESLDMKNRLFKGDHPDMVLGLNNLAILLEDQGKLADAELLFRDALAMSRRLLKGDHPDVAASLGNLATLLQARGKVADAEPLSRDALAMYRRLFKGDHPNVAIGLNNLAVLLWDQGKLADAELYFRDALAMYRRLLETFARQKSEGEVLTFVDSQPVTRSGLFSVARELKTDPAVVYSEMWADKAAVARIYERRQQAARAVTDPTTAKLVADLADARHRRAGLILAPEVRDPATRKKREDALKELGRKVAEFERDIRPRLPLVERGEKLGLATPIDLQKAMPANVAVVDYLAFVHFENDDTTPIEKRKQTWRYTAFVVTKDKVAWVDLNTAAKIESAIEAWREAITSGKEIPGTIPAKVRELIWEKVRKELPANIKTVYIAPDETLCRVPWGAIPGDKPGTILLEDFAIATIPHAPFLLDKLWEQDKLKNPPSGSLVVGGVNFDAEATAGPANRDLPIKPGTKTAWQVLPGAAAEAMGVESAAKMKGSVTTLKGEAATPAAVLAALPKAKYAHFATHGFFADPSFRSAFQLDEKDFQRTMRGERIGRAALSPLVMTGLVFAGANNPKTPGRGIVTGEALVDLDLSGLELAVLSACETGLGDVAGGEGTFGLQRAFHLAGTRDVVASLWKVPDAPTAALMAEFYRNLWEKNLSPMESLRQAQLFIYRNPGKIAELAAGFRAGFKEVKGDDTAIKPTADGKTPTRMWAAFTLSGPGR